MNRMFSQILNYTIATLISVVTGLFWTPLLIRMVEIDQFSFYTYLNQIYNTLLPLFMIGIYYIQTFGYNSKIKNKIRNINFILFALIFIVSILILEIAIYNIILIFLLIIVTNLYQLKMIVLNISNSSKEYKKSQNLFSILKVLFVIILLFFVNQSYYIIFIGIFLAYLIAANAYKIVYFNNIYKDSLNPTYIEIIKIGLMLVTFSFLSNFFILIDNSSIGSNEYLYAKYMANLLVLSSIINIPYTILSLFIIPKFYASKNYNFVYLILGVLFLLFMSLAFYLLYNFLNGNFILNLLVGKNYIMTSYSITSLLSVITIITILKYIAIFIQFNFRELYKYLILIIFLGVSFKIVTINIFDINNTYSLLKLNVFISLGMLLLTILLTTLSYKKYTENSVPVR